MYLGRFLDLLFGPTVYLGRGYEHGLWSAQYLAQSATIRREMTCLPLMRLIKHTYEVTTAERKGITCRAGVMSLFRLGDICPFLALGRFTCFSRPVHSVAEIDNMYAGTRSEYHCCRSLLSHTGFPRHTDSALLVWISNDDDSY